MDETHAQSVYLLAPGHDEVRAWLVKNAYISSQWQGDNLTVEHRHIEALMAGLRSVGFEESRDWFLITDHPRFEQTENRCNWCGSEKIEYECRVFGCDLDHTVYKCEVCGKFTWKHIYWFSCREVPRETGRYFVGR